MMIGKKAFTTVSQLGCNIGRRYIHANGFTAAPSMQPLVAARGITKPPFSFGTRPYCSGAATKKLKNLLDSHKKIAEQELLNTLNSKLGSQPKKMAEQLHTQIKIAEQRLLDTLNNSQEEPMDKTNGTYQGQSAEGITLKKLKEQLDIQHKKIEQLLFQHKKIAEQELLLETLNAKFNNFKKEKYTEQELSGKSNEQIDSQQKKIAEEELLLQTDTNKDSNNSENKTKESETSNADINNLEKEKNEWTLIDSILLVSVLLSISWLIVQVWCWIADGGSLDNCKDALLILLVIIFTGILYAGLTT